MWFLFELATSDSSYELTTCDSSYELTTCDSSYELNTCDSSYEVTTCDSCSIMFCLLHVDINEISTDIRASIVIKNTNIIGS